MNMSTAARQSILNGIIGTWIFFVPAVLLGFSPDLILGLLAANLAYQWFVHTESIGKLHIPAHRDRPFRLNVTACSGLS